MAKHQESPKKEKDKTQSEMVEKVLHINRCSKVVKGGRKFSFSALILASDGKGRVGYGFAKANELTDAIRKGGENARKCMRSYPVEGTTVPHEVQVHFDGATVLVRPTPKGSGMIAGSKYRDIMTYAGYTDVMVKNLGAANPLNMVKALFKALSMLRSRETIKKSRGQE